jgi:beta-galactosidase/beta-glucuronidase
VKVENDRVTTRSEGDKIYAATGLGYDDPARGWHHCPAGMGIYQDVYVEARSSMWIGDVFIRPLVEENRAEAWIEIWNTTGERQMPEVRLSVFGQNFRGTVLRNRRIPLIEELRADRSFVKFSFDMPKFRWWSNAEPWLYQAQVSLSNKKGKLLDMGSRQFGMRSFTMDFNSKPKGRMYFNGKEIRLRGANTMGHMQQCVFKKDWGQLRDDILLAKICNMNFFRLT